MSETHIIRHRSSLLALQKAGHIAEPPPHVRPANARWGTDYHYVDDTPTTPAGWFPWRGGQARVKYYSGCFFPFVEWEPAVSGSHVRQAQINVDAHLED